MQSSSIASTHHNTIPMEGCQMKETEYSTVRQKATVVSFDIPTQERTKRNIVHNLLYGRTEIKHVNGESRTYEYPGLLDEGGFRMGQSVFLLPPHLAGRLIQKLTELKISHYTWNVLLQD